MLITYENIWDELSKQYSNKELNVLIIVDGPPGSICNNARYPAFPIVMKEFKRTNICFLLDDYNRNDEIDSFNKWEILCKATGINYLIEIKKFDKYCALLKIVV